MKIIYVFPQSRLISKPPTAILVRTLKVRSIVLPRSDSLCLRHMAKARPYTKIHISMNSRITRELTNTGRSHINITSIYLLALGHCLSLFDSRSCVSWKCPGRSRWSRGPDLNVSVGLSEISNSFASCYHNQHSNKGWILRKEALIFSKFLFIA